MEIVQFSAFIIFATGLAYEMVLLKNVSLFPKFPAGVAYLVAFILLAISIVGLQEKAMTIFTFSIVYMVSKTIKISKLAKQEKEKKIEINTKGDK